jgi:hypothetical protein
MIKKITISAVLVVFVLFLYQGINKSLLSNQAGAPAKNTGSPGDAQNCATSCHNTPTAPTTVTGWISTNIPAGGYTPDTIYTVTVTATCPGKTIFGFQISPQDNIGNKKGTLLITDPTNTQIISTPPTTDSKFITHKTPGTTGSTGSHTWTFMWKAPNPTLATNVTFYGAFVAATGPTTDSVFLCTKTYSKVTGIETYSGSDFGLTMFPDPVIDKMTVTFFNSNSEMVDICIYDINGKQVAQLEKTKCASGKFTRTFDLTNKLSKGTYFVRVLIGDKSSSKKIVVL